VDPLTARVHFFGGDLVGMVVAEYLQADAVVVPISCNDAIDRGNLAAVVEPKTRIGSPFVIAGMEAALAKGKKRVCGWEPNGGFLTGSPIARNGAILQPLLTRDAGLPILGVLFAAEQKGLSLVDLFARLPKRFSRAALLKHFPRATALKIVARFSPPGGESPVRRSDPKDLALFFTPAHGFRRASPMWTTQTACAFSSPTARWRMCGPPGTRMSCAFTPSPIRRAAPTRSPPWEWPSPRVSCARWRKLSMVEAGVLTLHGVVQHYDWGGHTSSPSCWAWKTGSQTVCRAVDRRPCQGAIHGGVAGGQEPLDKLIAEAPERILGQAANARFAGRLPYLFKILDVHKMLSIQAHPTLAQAKEGFARENAEGISLEASSRNYKDDNHKPEIGVALTEFWMLHGFRPLEQIAETLARHPSWVR
jgi:hypothetical protein